MKADDFKPLQRPTQHEIDEQAKAFLNSTIPPKWIRNALTSDYGKDYLVEMGDEGSPKVKGNDFFVQLKGTASPQYTKDAKHICFSIKHKYSQYVHDEVTRPVFLIVVDLKAKKGYWIFMQEYLADPKNKKWKKQKSFSYRIPTANDISDVASWQPEIRKAIKHMQARSISLPDKIRYEIEQVERLDKRLTAVPFEMGLRIVPKEPVTFTCKQAKDDPEVKEKFRRLLDGEIVTFAKGEALILGSPLWERFNEHGGTLQMGTKIEGVVTPIVYDAEGREAARLSEIRGVWEGGKDLLFKSEKRMPFSLVVGPLEHNQANIQMTMNFRQWYNYRLLQLPFFDVLDTFVSAVLKHNNVTLELRT